jgi:S1-C subfamily serine protease
MLKIFKITASIFFFSFINTNLIAEEIFCLDDKGLILPLFEESNCSINTDIRIDEKEFMHIIEFSESERLTELKNFRENKLEIEKKQKEKLANKSDVEIKKVEDDQKILDQKKISNLAKQKEEKRIGRQKELETKKQKRLAQIEKQKKEKEEKRIARQKELEIKKKLQKEERIAKKKLEEKLRKEKLAKKNISDNAIIQPSDAINNQLKIIYFDKEIVKVELLPNINPSSDIDFEKLLDLNLELTKNLLASNSNLILIIPKDIDSFSTVTSEDSMTSQRVSGIRQIPNPEFNKLQMEIRRAERELQTAQRKEQDGFERSQCISCGLLVQWGGIAIQDKWQKVGNALQNRIVNLTNSYSSTPDYLEKEVIQSYSYVVQNINVEKKAIYQIIEFKDNKYKEKNISIDESKKFKVAYNIDPQDKKYETLLNKYSDTNQVTNWQNKKIKNISFDKFSTLIDNQESFKEITGIKELYASLNFDYVEPKELSWWERLFSSSKKENKKTASLSNKSSSDYELKDVRFDSVVIVKTESGLGSGFFISNDEILTNYHVIENSSTISVIDKFGKRSSAVVIKKDLKRDLALLKTNTTGKPVTFYSGQLKQGEMVEALGHPKGRKFSLTKGWISAIRKESAGYGATNEKNVLFIQTDAAINHGNSGGPLFYKDKVVGVNTQGLSKDRSEGMNFAVHFSEVNQFLSD